MDTISLLCIVVGALVITARAPLLFAPTATIDFYARLLGTDLRVRALGLGHGVLGLFLILPARDGAISDQIAYWIGWILVLGSLVLLAVPGPYRRFAESLFDQFRRTDTTAPRMIGVLGILIGALLVYLGFWLG